MSSVTASIDRPAAVMLPWDLSWLSAGRCRLMMIAVVVFVLMGHLLYLSLHCPIDLAEDEAYYWDWSRQLDMGYYSKGPVTACLIRASCAVFGDIPAAVRFPALFMGAGLTLCTWWLTRRLFGSDRLALGAVLLSHLAPMVIAAGLVITTDPPFLFFWALATCLAAVAIFDENRRAWLGVGAAVGVGFLTKFLMPIWLLGMLLFLALDRESRRHLRTPWPYVAILVAIPFTLPVFIWNMQHGWVTFLHVGEDVGAAAGQLQWRNIIGFWTGQMGVVGPLLFVLMMAAVARALYEQLARPPRDYERPVRRGMRFLLCMGLPVFVLVLLCSFRKHVAENWPASSYFTLLIITSRFLHCQLCNRLAWRFWRVLFYPAVASGLALVLIAHNTAVLYPCVAWFNARFPQHAMTVRKLDPAHRLHGWSETGQAVGGYLRTLGPEALVFAADYQTTAELAFYVPGQPRTYCAGSYFTDPAQREPFSQYDIWPDRRLDREWVDVHGLRGRDAVYVGPLNDDIRRAFDRVERLPEIAIRRGGLEVRRLELWACHHFHGLPWPGWNGKFNK